VIEEFLKSLPAPRLLVIDPIASYVDETVNPHADAQVRVMLRPLVELVDRWQMAGVYVTHLNKSEKRSAINRPGGSIAWVGACRASYVIAKQGEKRVMAPLKCNLGPPLGSVEYTLEQTGTEAIARVKWDTGAGKVSADELVGAGEPLSPSKAAERWLVERLDKPARAAQLQKEVARLDFGWRTCEKAKKVLGIKSLRNGETGDWWWQPPSPQ
jgi:hypothetical protein